MKKVIILFMILHNCIQLSAQNTTNSPSSMFGLGDLSTGEGGIYAGMGGTAIALRSPSYLSVANPASLTGIGSRKFLFNVGVMGAIKQYSQSNNTNNSVVGNVSNAGIGFRVTPRWYSAVTLSPVSSVGYFISLDQQIEGSPGSTVTSQFEGEGGISKIAFSNAFLITKHLSAGVNLSYITGSVTQTEKQGSMTIEEKSEKQALYADFGVQYNYPLDIDRAFTFGATYGYAQRLAQDNTFTVSSSSGSETIEENPNAVKQYLPQFFSIGAAYNSLKWIITAEYKYSDWSRMKSSRSGINYENQHRLAVGCAYTIGNPYKLPKQIMFGAGYYNSYVVIKNEQPRNFYLSAGMGFTAQNQSIISFGVKYNDQFNVSSSTQKERVFSLYLNLSFSERSYRAKLK